MDPGTQGYRPTIQENSEILVRLSAKYVNGEGEAVAEAVGECEVVVCRAGAAPKHLEQSKEGENLKLLWRCLIHNTVSAVTGVPTPEGGSPQVALRQGSQALIRITSEKLAAPAVGEGAHPEGSTEMEFDVEVLGWHELVETDDMLCFMMPQGQAQLGPETWGKHNRFQPNKWITAGPTAYSRTIVKHGTEGKSLSYGQKATFRCICVDGSTPSFMQGETGELLLGHGATVAVNVPEMLEATLLQMCVGERCKVRLVASAVEEGGTQMHIPWAARGDLAVTAQVVEAQKQAVELYTEALKKTKKANKEAKNASKAALLEALEEKENMDALAAMKETKAEADGMVSKNVWVTQYITTHPPSTAESGVQEYELELLSLEPPQGFGETEPQPPSEDGAAPPAKKLDTEELQSRVDTKLKKAYALRLEANEAVILGNFFLASQLPREAFAAYRRASKTFAAAQWTVAEPTIGPKEVAEFPKAQADTLKRVMSMLLNSHGSVIKKLEDVSVALAPETSYFSEARDCFVQACRMHIYALNPHIRAFECALREFVNTDLNKLLNHRVQDRVSVSSSQAKDELKKLIKDAESKVAKGNMQYFMKGAITEESKEVKFADSTEGKEKLRKELSALLTAADMGKITLSKGTKDWIHNTAEAGLFKKVEATEKEVEQLWENYKAKVNPPPATTDLDSPTKQPVKKKAAKKKIDFGANMKKNIEKEAKKAEKAKVEAAVQAHLAKTGPNTGPKPNKKKKTASKKAGSGATVAKSEDSYGEYVIAGLAAAGAIVGTGVLLWKMRNRLTKNTGGLNA